MRIDAKLAVLIALAGVCSGCMTEEHRRADGITDNAGEAIAANTVMQMVDPWQEGVQDTRLRVPAVRGAPAAAASGDGSQSQTMDSGS